MRATVLALSLLLWGPTSRAEDLLWYSEDGTVVFTNVPEPGARPVPGLKERRVVAGPDLPSTPYDPFIESVAREYALEPALIKAVALVESGFNARAVSPKGARGIMQLMPGTARMYGVRDIHDPHENLRAGAAHLRTLLDEFEGDLTLALAAYNAGSGAVKRHGGVPRYRETQDYVRKVESRLAGGARRPRRTAPAEPAAITLRQNADGSITLDN